MVTKIEDHDTAGYGSLLTPILKNRLPEDIKAWFSYIVIHRRCPCDFIVGDRRWIKSFVFLKSFSPSVISHNRSATKCDELRYMKTKLNVIISRQFFGQVRSLYKVMEYFGNELKVQETCAISIRLHPVA